MALAQQKHSCNRAVLLVFAGLFGLIRHTVPGTSLTGSSSTSNSALRGTSALSLQAVSDYPELTRVESLIYDGCLVKDGQEEIECLRLWDKLKKYHEEAELECNLDDMRCVVLDVLDRLCTGIDGQDGLVLLNKVSSAVLAFREKFVNWDAAFAAADTDRSGALDLDELTAVMKSMNVGLTDSEIALVFTAADSNGDGVISQEEFNNFLTAAVFAEEPLRELQPDKLSKKQPSFEEYLRWTSKGSQSFAGIAKLAR